MLRPRAWGKGKRSDLVAEITAGVAFWGWEDFDTLVGVMGLQKVRDATLIRHAYVRPAGQGRGIGGALLATLAGQITGPLLVGKDLNHPNRVGSSFRRTPPSAIVHAVPEFIWAISV